MNGAPLDHRQGIRVLVVEDDEEDWKITRRLLGEIQELDCAPEWVSTFDHAVTKLGSAAFDLCLLDYRLGTRDGLDIVKEAVFAGCRFPIVFVTGQEDISLAVEAIKAGASDYLIKRLLSAELLERTIMKALHMVPPSELHARAAEFKGTLPVGSKLLEYRVERMLGHGGFGVTYLARDMHLDKLFAIKEYAPAALTSRGGDENVSARSPSDLETYRWGLDHFISEARTLARFTHPNLIRVHRFFEANHTAYMVMDYVEGETFSTQLTRDKALSYERLRAVLFPILSGIEQVHRAGCLHRDIKPENIMLCKDGSPVMIDFGAARVSLGAKTQSVLSVVTAGYAPLEQYSTTGNQGPWTDIYALAGVAYRALSGKKPPEAPTRITEDPLKPAAAVGRNRYPAAFLEAVDWALAVNPEDRPLNVGDWQRALIGQLPPPRKPAGAEPARAGPHDPTRIVHVPPAHAPPAADEPLHSKKIAWALVAAAVALIGFALAYLFYQLASVP